MDSEAFTAEQRQALRELADSYNDQSISRRDIMKLAGAGGVGALLGGGGIAGVSGSASAGTAQSGTIGTNTDPVDIVSEDTDVLDTLSINSDLALIANAASGSVTLSSGSGTVDTGLSATDATFYLALGVDDPDADVKVAGKLFWDDSAGTYKVEFTEVDTSVGNPTVNYDILRVR